MKQITLTILIGFTLLFFSCKKDSPDPKDTITIGQLNATYTPITPTTSSASTTFWTRSSVYNTTGSLYLYVDNNFAGTISNYSSSAPSCGLSTNVNLDLSTGTHSWYAVSIVGFYQIASSAFPRSFTVSNVSCNKVEITF
jgi:hypothetical protein